MWRKTKFLFTVSRNAGDLVINNLRNIRLLGSASNASYLKNPGTEPLTHASIGEVIEATAHKYPGRIAVRSFHEDISITYEQLIKQADALGCALRAQGLEKGDRVGIWGHNTATWVIALLACARAGLISVAINPAYVKDELNFCVRKTNMKGLIIGEDLPNRRYKDILNQLVPELQNCKAGSVQSKTFPALTSVITCSKDKFPGVFNIDSLLSEYSNSDVSKYFKQVQPEDGSIIYFTSGTTGEPKGGLLSHLNVVNNSYFIGKRLLFHEGHQKICLQAPLFHVLGSVVTLMSGMRHGASLVLAAPIYKVTSNVKALLAEKCTAITGTPTMHVDMMAAMKSSGQHCESLRVALAAGAPCSPQLIRNIQTQLNAQTVLTLYGLTESTASTFQSLSTDTIDQVAETVGYLMDHVEVKVVNSKGETVTFGTEGELMSRGYNTMLGYWDEPEKTRNTVSEDGWLSTGDKFKIDADGYGRIVGRIKDIIVRGGENIAPKEIEDLLNTHPDILESQVVGVSDVRLGEELCAVLRVKEGVSFTQKDVADFLTGKLAKFKIPKLLKIANDFPKTASGKIQKHKIKEFIESGKI